jgi:hypothetical protein
VKLLGRKLPLYKKQCTTLPRSFQGCRVSVPLSDEGSGRIRQSLTAGRSDFPGPDHETQDTDRPRLIIS